MEKKTTNKRTSWNKGLKEYFIGSNNPHWKGGKPKCAVCKKTLTRKDAKNCLLHRSTINTKRGPNHPNWRGGTTVARKKVYDSPEYNKWRKIVLSRDNYTCQMCGKQSKKGKFVSMSAHHILSYSAFPEFGLDPKNGATLCTLCHFSIRRKEWMYIPRFLNL